MYNNFAKYILMRNYNINKKNNKNKNKKNKKYNDKKNI